MANGSESTTGRTGSIADDPTLAIPEFDVCDGVFLLLENDSSDPPNLSKFSLGSSSPLVVDPIEMPVSGGGSIRLGGGRIPCSSPLLPPR